MSYPIYRFNPVDRLRSLLLRVVLGFWIALRKECDHTSPSLFQNNVQHLLGALCTGKRKNTQYFLGLFDTGSELTLIFGDSNVPMIQQSEVELMGVR